MADPTSAAQAVVAAAGGLNPASADPSMQLSLALGQQQQQQQQQAQTSPQQHSFGQIYAGGSSNSEGFSPKSTSNGIQPAPMHAQPSQQQQSLQDPGYRRSLLVDYYRYLYRFIPVLLPTESLEDFVQSFGPDSPFLLTLQCILPLLRDEEQPPGPLHGLGGSGLNFGSSEKKKRVRDLTMFYQRQASDAIDAALEKADETESPAAILEVIQALCVLIIYEYGSGRALKARLKADQALGLAMSKGLHRLSSQNMQDVNGSSGAFAYFPADKVYEMSKRTWWVVWSLLMWASYNTGRIPTIRADDPRVTSELPNCKDENAWASNVLSLQALLLVQDRVLALAQSNETDSPEAQIWSPQNASGKLAELGQNFGLGAVPITASRSESNEAAQSFSERPATSPRQKIVDSMKAIDESLKQQIALIESRQAPKWQSSGGHQMLSAVEDDLIAYLHLGTAIQLYTAWLTLHLSSAFQGASLFERKLCFLSKVGETNNKQICQVPIPDSFGTIFPVDTNAQSLSMDTDPADWASRAFTPFTGNAPDSRVSDWTYSGDFFSAPDPAPKPVAQPQVSLQGAFDPRYSLDRCVYASKRLLELSRGDALKVNPFPACSHVLIAFTLLMQALSLSDGVADEEDEEDNDIPDYSRELLHSAQSSAALQGHDQSRQGSRQQRLVQLHEIWAKVKEARDTLTELSKYWDMVTPMADEVNVCLQTSQLLFDQGR